VLFNSKVPYLRWPELLNSLPELEYLLYTDISTVLEQLKTAHGIESIRDGHGAILELAKA
jgi:hypothetical protein